MGVGARQGAGKSRAGTSYGEGLNTAWGFPNATGLAWVEDFITSNVVSSRIGEQEWTVVTSAGGSVTLVSPTAATEAGLCAVRMNAPAAGAVSYIHGGAVFPVYGPPAIGTVWTTKAAPEKPSAGTHYYFWSGLISNVGTMPQGGLNVDYLGVRYDGTTGAWEGVVRNNTTESVVSIGVVASLVHTIMGWERTSDGFQFFTLDCSNPRRVVRTDVGSPIAANFPDTPLTPWIASGVPAGQSVPTGVHGIRVDWMSLGGRTAR